MNPNLCRVALRPRSPFEVFDLTLRFARERARPLLWLTLWTVGPAFAGCLLVAWLMDFSLGAVFVAVLVGPVVHAPFTLLGGRLLFQDDASVAQAIKDSFRATGAVVLTTLAEYLQWALVCTGIGVIALPVFVYLPETALLERVPLARGIGRTSRLAAGQVGVAVVAAAGRWILLFWGGLVGELTGQVIVGFLLQLGQPFGSLEGGVLTPYLLLGVLLTHPLYALFRLLLYVDVRTRMEGWDLQVGLRALGLEDAA